MVTNKTTIAAAVRPHHIVPHPRLVCKVTAGRCFRSQSPLHILAVTPDALHQTGVHIASGEYLRIARENHLAARSGERHVELAVYHTSVLLKTVSREETELRVAVHRERADYHVALRALESFHSVDAYVRSVTGAAAFHLAAYHGDLVAVRHYHAYGRSVRRHRPSPTE